MRVHMQNIIGSAIQRGVVGGYQKASHVVGVALPPKKSEQFVEILLDSIWESLDSYIDFSEPNAEDEPHERPRPIGFSTEAVGKMLPGHDDECECDDDDERIIPLG